MKKGILESHSNPIGHFMLLLFAMFLFTAAAMLTGVGVNHSSSIMAVAGGINADSEAAPEAGGTDYNTGDTIPTGGGGTRNGGGGTSDPTTTVTTVSYYVTTNYSYTGLCSKYYELSSSAKTALYKSAISVDTSGCYMDVKYWTKTIKKWVSGVKYKYGFTTYSKKHPIQIDYDSSALLQSAGCRPGSIACYVRSRDNGSGVGPGGERVTKGKIPYEVKIPYGYWLTLILDGYKQEAGGVYTVHFSVVTHWKYATIKTTSTETESQWCSYDWSGYYQYSTSKTSLESSTKYSAYSGSSPNKPYISSDGQSIVGTSCFDGGRSDVRVKVTASVDPFKVGAGYYKLFASQKTKIFTRTVYTYSVTPADAASIWDGESSWTKTTDWSASNPITVSSTKYFALSCSVRTQAQVEGSIVSSLSSLMSLSSSSIANYPAFCDTGTTTSTWKCDVSADSSIVGLNNSVVGTSSANQTVQVMRNGDPVSYSAAKLRLLVKNGSNWHDIMTGGSGEYVRNVSGFEYKTTVKSGSTPFNGNYGSDENSSDQYFTLYNSSGAKDTFNSWKSASPSSQDTEKTISFYWASDDGKPFYLVRSYRVTAEFKVTDITGTVTSNGVASSNADRWVEDTVDCYSWNSSSGNQNIGSALTSTSNAVEVVRSVN